MADLADVARFMAGATLVKQGEIGDSFYVVLTGQAKVVASGRTLNRLLPGEHFGEISLLDGEPRSASVVAETEMTLVIITQKDFLAMLAKDPGDHASACWKAWLEPSAGSTARSPGSLPYVKVELHRPDEPDAVVATVAWTDGRPVIDTQDDILRATLQKVFRRTPVVVDDASYRRHGDGRRGPDPAGRPRMVPGRRADARPRRGRPGGAIRPGSPRAASIPRPATGRSRSRSSGSRRSGVGARVRWVAPLANHDLPSGQNARKSQYVQCGPGVAWNAPASIDRRASVTRAFTTSGSSMGCDTSSPLAR